MSILGSLLGGSGGGGGTAAGSGAGGPVSQSGQAGPNVITVNSNSPQQSPYGSGIQNVGSILALLNQGSAMNGAVNYNQSPLFQSLNPLPQSDPYQPATYVGPAPKQGLSMTTLLLVATAGVLLFVVMRKG